MVSVESDFSYEATASIGAVFMLIFFRKSSDHGVEPVQTISVWLVIIEMTDDICPFFVPR
ncbi:MAG: hypothetical protein PUF12_08235 [Thermoflexaceae bacterium]|nr:hypothetical protein [Thermoflexaceae bacterium]